MKRLLTAVAALAAAMLAGCAPSSSGSVYSRDQARQEQTVRMGVVDSVRQVQIEGTRSGIGPAAGGVAGQAAEQAGTRKSGVEITVRLDNGSLVAITQEADETTFAPGDRVRILSGGGVSRVAR